MHTTPLESAVSQVARQRTRNVVLASSEVKLARGLLVLAEASRYAQQTGCNAWEFAVEIHRLFELGLRENELRFLVRMQLVAHAHEVKSRNGNVRAFKQAEAMCFTSSSCFVSQMLASVIVDSLRCAETKRKASL